MNSVSKLLKNAPTYQMETSAFYDWAAEMRRIGEAGILIPMITMKYTF